MNERAPDGSSPADRIAVEHLSDVASVARIAPEWEALAARQRPWSPFRGPAWNLTWWRHLAERGPLVRDRLSVRAIRSSQGRLIAVAPLMITERPATGPLRIRMLQFLGADPSITEVRGIVCDSEYERSAYRALFEDLRRDGSEWDFVRWTGIHANGPALDVLGAHPDVAVVNGAPAFVLDLPGSWADLKARLPRNIKESLRKCYNSLKRDGHRFEFRAAEGVHAVAALEGFHRLHELRAESDANVAHSNVFGNARSRDFLRDYVAGATPRSCLVFELVIGGEVVASRIGFRSGAALYLYYSGFHPSWARYSVMTTLLAEALKWAVSEGIPSVHLSFGRDVSKTRWRPREVPFLEARWSSPSLRGRLFQQAFRHIDTLRHHERFGHVTRAVLSQLGPRALNAPE